VSLWTNYSSPQSSEDVAAATAAYTRSSAAEGFLRGCSQEETGYAGIDINVPHGFYLKTAGNIFNS